MSEENTRPVSVAELLARNGTIGSPPVGGHRRRKRRNAVSVAELTGEIPVIRTGEIPVVGDDEPADVDESGSYEQAPVEVSAETVIVYSSSGFADSYAEDSSADVVPDYADYQDYTPGYDEIASAGAATAVAGEPMSSSYSEPREPAFLDTASHVEAARYVESVDYVESAGYAAPAPGEPEHEPEPEPTLEPVAETPAVAVRDDVVAERQTESRIEAPRPPLSSVPLPRRRRGPERGHDPRPRRRSTAPEPPSPARRSSGAEQMSPDPVDESVDLAELVAEQAPDRSELRSYLKSSTATLFFGETVADDLARRGESAESGDYRNYDNGDDYEDTDGGQDEREVADDGAGAPRRGPLSVLGTSLVAVLQSLLAVVFGAALFIGFDQLWRWNNIVALALSALVIAALMIGVHVVRKTEDFVSTLIAALVGILVTFGPLALQST